MVIVIPTPASIPTPVGITFNGVLYRVGGDARVFPDYDVFTIPIPSIGLTGTGHGQPQVVQITPYTPPGQVGEYVVPQGRGAIAVGIFADQPIVPINGVDAIAQIRVNNGIQPVYVRAKVHAASNNSVIAGNFGGYIVDNVWLPIEVRF